jgi:hypothetical protein
LATPDTEGMWHVTIENVSLFFYCLLSYQASGLYKYLSFISGYHKCSKDEASRLAALVYRVRFGESKQELQAIP